MEKVAAAPKPEPRTPKSAATCIKWYETDVNKLAKLGRPPGNKRFQSMATAMYVCLTIYLAECPMSQCGINCH